MSLDLIAGIFCGVTALCVFSLHCASGPDRRSWISLPGYVRFGFAAVGVSFTLRSADFFSIAGRDVDAGNINGFGLMGAGAMAYLGIVSVVCIYRNRLRNGHWADLQEVERNLLAPDGDLVPVAIPQAKLTTVLRAFGWGVNAELPAAMAAPADPENKSMR